MDVGRSRRRKGTRRNSKRYPQPLSSRTSADRIEEAAQPHSTLAKSRSARMHARGLGTMSISPPELGDSSSSKVDGSQVSPVTVATKEEYGQSEHADSSRKSSKKRKLHSVADEAGNAKEESGLDKTVEEISTETPNVPSTADIQLRMEALEQENARLQREVASKNGLLEKQKDTISYIYGQCICTVCMELVWRPHVLSPCGHVFCARCLMAWFTK